MRGHLRPDKASAGISETAATMTSIERLSFDFVMDDEAFAHRLYAEWDSFCRDCFERIAEECLARFDSQDVIMQWDKLEIDLGNIPQELFFKEFPRRLREELLKLASHYPLGDAHCYNKYGEYAIDLVILRYLRQGVSHNNLSEAFSSLTKKITELAQGSSSALSDITELCMKDSTALRRLLIQCGQKPVLLEIFSIGRTKANFTSAQQRHWLETFLDLSPDVPIRYVRQTSSETMLREMSELFGTYSVRRMMEKETEKHAEVGLAPYWHYLYEWLIQYYPFNGLAMFGSKRDFISLLKFRFLTFIHKRAGSSTFLAKESLTAEFLMEVFGSDYYREMLKAIYLLQPRKKDRSPANDGYYSMELYRILMKLHLLEFPESDEEAKLFALAKKVWQSEPRSAEELVAKQHLTQDTLLSSIAKRNFGHASILAGAIKKLEQMKERLPLITKAKVPFTLAISIALLRFIGDNDTLRGAGMSEEEIIKRFLRHLQSSLFPESTSSDRAYDNSEWVGISHAICGKEQKSRVIPTKEDGEKNEDNGPTEISFANDLKATIRENPYQLLSWNEESLIALLSELIEDQSIPAEQKRQLLRMVQHARPDALMAFVRISMANGEPKENYAMSWMEPDDWLSMIANLSLSLERTLGRMVEVIRGNFVEIGDQDISAALASLLLEKDTAHILSNLSVLEITDFMMNRIPFIVKANEETRKSIMQRAKQSMLYEVGEYGYSDFIEDLQPSETKNFGDGQLSSMRLVEDEQERLAVGNAGLSLLAPWFSRLFDILGYLCEDRKDFKDNVMRIRAIFLLQYIAFLDETEWQEGELAFNRILTALPVNVPLPKNISLTENEKNVALGMIGGAKANWPKMSGTSVESFVRSFIAREGILESQESKWLLTVSPRAYDVLIGTVPWPFRQIRLPWLGKYVQVSWHEKQEY